MVDFKAVAKAVIRLKSEKPTTLTAWKARQERAIFYLMWLKGSQEAEKEKCFIRGMAEKFSQEELMDMDIDIPAYEREWERMEEVLNELE